MKFLNIYDVSFHGYGLWDFMLNNYDGLYKEGNVADRLAFQVPSNTHSYIIEGISGCLHPKVMLASRHIKFAEQLK